MKFLADMGISTGTLATLRERGHDAVHARELGLARASDATILERARVEGRIVLTAGGKSAGSAECGYLPSA